MFCTVFQVRVEELFGKEILWRYTLALKVVSMLLRRGTMKV